MALMRLIYPCYVFFSTAAWRYRNLIPCPPVKRVFTTVISATMDVAVNIKDAIDEAGAKQCAKQEIGRAHIKDHGEPPVHCRIRREHYAGSNCKKQQETGCAKQGIKIDQHETEVQAKRKTLLKPATAKGFSSLTKKHS